MRKKDILNLLKDDKEYYGEFGKQFLSNSNISSLLTDPLSLHENNEKTSAMLIGGYFHHLILEPHKAKEYKIIQASSRNTKKYKEESKGELLLLEKEAENVEELAKHIEANDTMYDIIYTGNLEYEVPQLGKIFGLQWKGKADILNHDKKLIVDLKTTSDIQRFEQSANKYNYDSQAYIYQNLFPGYEFIFAVVDKKTKRLGIFDCSSPFLKRGEEKVKKACEAYNLFYKTKDFNKEQYFLTKTL